MTDLRETGAWVDGIYQIETADPVLGGPPDLTTKQGVANIQALQLANRTAWLKALLEAADPLGQYLNQTRGDARYHTRAQVNQKFTDLDNEADPFSQYLTPSRGDARYHTQAAADGRYFKKAATFSQVQAHQRFYTKTEANNLYYIRSQVDALIDTRLGSLLPVGSILPYAGATAPSGFFICDGSTFSASLRVLRGILGSRRLPDLRGEFLRVWDNGRGIDAGRALRSWQGQQIESHTHSFLRGNRTGSGSSNGFYYDNAQSSSRHAGNGAIYNYGGQETRPRNVALNAIIRHDYV